MNWNKLEDMEQRGLINKESETVKVMILKHSTRCSISSMALNRIESNWKDDDNNLVKPYYLDLLAHRDISNLIAQWYEVEHQSPQVLIISKGKCIYYASHNEIRYPDIMDAAKK